MVPPFSSTFKGRLVVGSFRNLLAEPRGTAKTLEITAPNFCEQRSVTQMRKLPVYNRRPPDYSSSLCPPKI